eukprot:s198_g4.t1
MAIPVFAGLQETATDISSTSEGAKTTRVLALPNSVLPLCCHLRGQQGKLLKLTLSKSARFPLMNIPEYSGKINNDRLWSPFHDPAMSGYGVDLQAMARTEGPMLHFPWGPFASLEPGPGVRTEYFRFDNPLHLDGIAQVGYSDEEAMASQQRVKLTAETASRANRVLGPMAREAIKLEVQAVQRRLRAAGRKSVMVTPPCLWCGLPTGCYCDQCRKPVCTTCDAALAQCVECCCKKMGCAEGKARVHGAMVLKQGGSNVDPTFAALPFEEKAKFFLEHGIPVDPNAELKERQRTEPAQSKPRSADLRQVQEALNQRAQQAEAQKEAEQCSARLQAEEDAKLSEEIDRQNHLARALRNNRRRGAGAAPSQIQKDNSRAQPDKRPVEDLQEKELSKAQARRLRQQSNRAAAAARKKIAEEQAAREQFLRETAEGFVAGDKQAPLEPILPQKRKEPKIKPPKEVGAKNQIAEDLLIGLWEAKHKHKGQSPCLSLTPAWRLATNCKPLTPSACGVY